jgi:hypothetical protein
MQQAYVHSFTADTDLIQTKNEKPHSMHITCDIVKTQHL